MSGRARRPARAAVGAARGRVVPRARPVLLVLPVLLGLTVLLVVAAPVTADLARGGDAAPAPVPPAAGQEQPGTATRPPQAGGRQPLPGPLPGEPTSRPLGLPVALAALACGGVASLLVRVLLAEPAARSPRC